VKDPRVYLAHILECIQHIEQFTATGRDAFYAQPMIHQAVIRNFEIIGEAAKRVSPAFRQQHPELPWKEMTGFRDVLIHDYEDLNLDEIWNTIVRDLPLLKSGVQKILPPLDQLEQEIAGSTPPGTAPKNEPSTDGTKTQ
jgi:uncharacterized protein with HEPN domain